MTDRIAELRALMAADDAAWRESRNHPSRETLRAYVESGEVLDEAVMNALPALLDCAEALKPFARINLGELYVYGVFADNIFRARNALARLHGDDHD